MPPSSHSPLIHPHEELCARENSTAFQLFFLGFAPLFFSNSFSVFLGSHLEKIPVTPPRDMQLIPVFGKRQTSSVRTMGWWNNSPEMLWLLSDRTQMAQKHSSACRVGPFPAIQTQIIFPFGGHTVISQQKLILSKVVPLKVQ